MTMLNALGSAMTEQEWLRHKPRLRKLYQVWMKNKPAAFASAVKANPTMQAPIDINQKEEIK